MKTSNRIKVVCAGLIGLLAGCGHQPLIAPSPVAHWGTRTTGDAGGAGQEQRTSFDSVDAYKTDVAEHVMRYNSAHTFEGRLPPMLPAIVVLNITVDSDGRITKAAVQRSRDADASRVALASMHRSAPLPRPFNLATGARGSLTFSETFLFNADYRFQLRTLAGVQ